MEKTKERRVRNVLKNTDVFIERTEKMLDVMGCRRMTSVLVNQIHLMVQSLRHSTNTKLQGNNYKICFMEYNENEAAFQASEKVRHIEYCIENIWRELNDLTSCLRIPSLRSGKIDISAYFNNSIYDWDYYERTFQHDSCFITFPVLFRCETKKVTISLVSEDSIEFKERLASLTDYEYGYEVYSEGFVIGEYKLPVIVINGKRYSIL